MGTLAYQPAAAPHSSSTPWHPRSPPGEHHLSPEDLVEAAGLPRADVAPPCHIIRPTHPSSQMDGCIAEMLQYGIIEPTDADAPVSGPIYLRPVTATKTAAIFDLHQYSLTQHHDPVRFSLPLPSDLQPHILAARPHAFMTRIDTSRYYDSLVLPPDGPRFVIAYRGRRFVYRRLPFGWDRAPAIAQRLSLRIVSTAIAELRFSGPVSVLVYLDDVIVLADRSDDAAAATDSIVAQLRAVGLIPNLDKSVLVPTPRIEALGRLFDTVECTISPTPAAISAAVHAALRVASAPTSRRTKLATAGLLLWTSRRVLPLLQRLYAAAHAGRHRPRPTRQLSRDLLRAAAFVARDYWHADAWSLVTAPSPIPAPGRRTYFVDASAERGLAAVVSPCGFMRVWRVPRFITDQYRAPALAQQAAELFGVTKATRLALARREPALIVPDSTSALYATLRLSSGAFSPIRAQLLARVAAACSRYPRHDVEFAWIDSESMPADPLTYPCPDMPEVARRLVAATRVLPPPPAEPSPALTTAVRSEPAFGGLLHA